MEYEYTYIVSDDKKEFETLVGLKLNSGWELQGGICVVYISESEVTGKFTYFQALTRVLDSHGYTIKRD